MSISRKWKSLSCVQLFTTLWTVVHGILQARTLEWVDFPFSGDFPNPGIEPRSPPLQANSLPADTQGKPMSINRWTDKDNMVYTYNGILFSLKTRKSFYMPQWVNFEKIILTEIGQPSKTDTEWTRLHKVPEVVWLIEAESRMHGGWQELGKGRNELLFDGDRVSVMQDQKVLEIYSVMWID